MPFDQPISLSVIVDLPSAVPTADRLLDIRPRQMPLIQTKDRVRCPDKSVDGHETAILGP
jgi:hypothetical protein